MNKILPGITYEGKISWFGGFYDKGVTPDEGLALFNSVNEAPELFLPYQPEGTTGLARRLDPSALYCAMRFDYSKTPKSVLRMSEVMVTYGDRTVKVKPCDWGPHEDTGRIIDLSPGTFSDLGLNYMKDTDKIVKCVLIEPNLKIEV